MLPQAGSDAADAIVEGSTALGIELGSTRIKAALISPTSAQIASGSHEWTNKLVDGIWTYEVSSVIEGLQGCFADLAGDVSHRYGVPLTRVGVLGFSAMMHGYIAMDETGELLVPFRTWRNTSTAAASTTLTGVFGQNIPQRWSIAHLYQAMLNGEDHLFRVAHLTTLAGWVHWQLTGLRVLGVGDASGMFPIDVETGQFDTTLIERFDELTADRGYPWRLAQILPDVRTAGEQAGTLTARGAALLDPSGTLAPGAPLCPPEGDAGTGMVATNSVSVGTGNVSAGTSIFAMAVLERPMRSMHSEIDLVTTPAGKPVAMVHCNNGTGELDAWVALFGELAAALGVQVKPSRLYEVLYTAGLTSDLDGGGLLAYNYLSGEPIAAVDDGRPLFLRSPQSRFTLANFVRTQLYATLGALRLGMDILRDEEVHLRRLFAHGGLFKTTDLGAQLLAAALETPISTGELAGEGGPWGMALLAAYARAQDDQPSLEDYLAERVFTQNAFRTFPPDPAEVEGFTSFFARYRQGLALERQAGLYFS